MVHVIQRNLALLVGMVLCGFICLKAAQFLDSPRGAAGPLVLASQSPMIALAVVVACVLVSALVAGLAGRYSNAAVGVFVLGVGLYVLDGRLSTIAEPAFGVTGIGIGVGDLQVGGGTVLVRAGIESLLLATVCLAAVLIVFRVAGPLADVEPTETGDRPHWLKSKDAIRAAVCGVLVVPVLWVIAQSPMKGQMLAAAFLGSLIVGMIGRLVSPHIQPLLLFVTPMVFGGLSQLVAAAMFKPPLDVAYVTQSLWKFSLVMPLDLAAGSLAGVAVGYGWARSFLHHEDEPEAQPT
jgi:hypothetical protein